MLVDLVKEIKDETKDIKDELKSIKDKQEATAIDVAVLEAMQKAIESLEIDKRLRRVETKVETVETKGSTGISIFAWLVPTIISVLGLGLAVIPYLKR